MRPIPPGLILPIRSLPRHKFPQSFSATSKPRWTSSKPTPTFPTACCVTCQPKPASRACGSSLINGSATARRIVRTGMSGFAHAPTRKMSADDIQLIKDRGVFVITTLTVEEYSGRRRLSDLRFLDQPLIADTTPPWFLTELRAEAARKLTDGEQKEVQGSAAGFDEMKRNVKKLFDAGVLLAAGTDAPYPGVFQ